MVGLAFFSNKKRKKNSIVALRKKRKSWKRNSWKRKSWNSWNIPYLAYHVSLQCNYEEMSQIYHYIDLTTYRIQF
jgi:hypothetical protein